MAISALYWLHLETKNDANSLSFMWIRQNATQNFGLEAISKCGTAALGCESRSAQPGAAVQGAAVLHRTRTTPRGAAAIACQENNVVRE
jgi:hypothetical protein